MLRVVRGRIRTITNRRQRKNSSGVGAGHNHFAPVANGKEAPSGRIEGQSRRRIATGKRPHGKLGMSLRIKPCDLVLVFDVDVDISLAVGTGNSGLPGTERSGNCARRRVYNGHILAPSVERPDCLGNRFVDDPIRVSSRRNGGQDSEAGTVKHHHRVPRAIASVPGLAIGVERHPMRALQTGHSADRLAGGCIDHFYSRIMRHI